MSLADPVAKAYALYRDAIEVDAEAAVRASLLEEVEASRCRAEAQIAAEKAKCEAACQVIATTEALAQKVLEQSLEALRPNSHVATATATLFVTRDAVPAEVECKAAEVAADKRAAAAAETAERKAGEVPADERAAEAAEAKRKAFVAAAAGAQLKAVVAAAAEAKRKVTKVMASVGADHQSSPLAESATAVPPSPSAADEIHASTGKRSAAIGEGSVAKRKKVPAEK